MFIEIKAKDGIDVLINIDLIVDIAIRGDVGYVSMGFENYYYTVLPEEVQRIKQILKENNLLK